MGLAKLSMRLRVDRRQPPTEPLQLHPTSYLLCGQALWQTSRVMHEQRPLSAHGVSCQLRQLYSSWYLGSQVQHENGGADSDAQRWYGRPHSHQTAQADVFRDDPVVPQCFFQSVGLLHGTCWLGQVPLSRPSKQWLDTNTLHTHAMRCSHELGC